MIRSQPFSEPTATDCEFHENLSFFPPVLGEAEWLEGAEVEHFLPPTSHPPTPSRLWTSQQIRLWLNSFPRWQVLTKRTEWYGIFQTVSFFPSSCWKCEGIFLRYLLWELGWTLLWLNNTVGAPHDCSLELLTQTCPCRGSSNSQLQFRFSFPNTGFLVYFLLSRVSALINCDSLYSIVLLDLVSSVFYFSVCQTFYTMLEWSGDLQAPYMWNWKSSCIIEGSL